jgi:hypothetical protein
MSSILSGGSERRVADRARFAGLFVNKFLGGIPHLARVLDLSATGMMVRKVLEPEIAQPCFALELGIPWRGDRFWIWARCVRNWGDLQAVRFLGLAEEDRARLADIVAEVRQTA